MGKRERESREEIERGDWEESRGEMEGSSEERERGSCKEKVIGEVRREGKEKKRKEKKRKEKKRKGGSKCDEREKGSGGGDGGLRSIVGMRVRVREGNGREWKGDEDEEEEDKEEDEEEDEEDEVVGEVMCCDVL